MCKNFELYDFKDEKFDLIVNVNYLDRCSSIEFSVRKFCEILSEQGIVVGCTPMNFNVKQSWEAYKNVDRLRDVFEKKGLKYLIYSII